jgi:hypothetical protein
VGETYVYVLGTRIGNTSTQEEQVSKLLDGAASWGGLIGVHEASDLMNEHTLGVKALADAAFARDQDTVNSAVDLLLSNLDKQTDLYQRKIPGFPAEEWSRLFSTHITATGGYILALAAGDMIDYKAKYNQVIQNRNDLARFWGRMCMGSRK